MKLRTRATTEAGIALKDVDLTHRSRGSSAAKARPAVARAPKGGVQKRRVAARRSVLPARKPEPLSEMPPPPASAPALGRRASRTRTPAPVRANATPRRQARTRPVAEDADEENQELVEMNEEKNDKDEERPKTIDDLPEEVMLGIFSYFRPPQLCWKIGRVCRQWASWSVSSVLWKNKEYVLSPDPKLASKQKV